MIGLTGRDCVALDRQAVEGHAIPYNQQMALFVAITNDFAVAQTPAYARRPRLPYHPAR